MALAAVCVLLLAVAGLGAASLLSSTTSAGNGIDNAASSPVDGASGQKGPAQSGSSQAQGSGGSSSGSSSGSSGGSGSSSGAASGSSSRGGAASPADEDRSGTVVYRYVVGLGDDDERTVVETVRFGRDGRCETSDLEATLADVTAAAAFLEALERDYGSALQHSSAQGATVKATLDVSANKLDREKYEDVLRDSVDDLSIVSKS